MLAQELDDHADEFARATPQIPGVLGVCLRASPADLTRHSFTRLDRHDIALDVDLRVSEEQLVAASIAQQRELVGAELRRLRERGCTA